MTHIKLDLSKLVILAAVAANGCSQGKEVIGDQPSTQTKTGLAAYAANWDGYIEAYNFADGTDRVRITVNEAGTGTLRFGEADLLPTPTDPNAKFPADFPMCQWGCYVVSALPDVWDGFQFSLNGVRVETERLRATAANKEVFAKWCSLQTSHRDYYSGGYSCATCTSNFGGDDSTIKDTCSVASPCPAYAADAGSVNFVPTLCEDQLLCVGSSGTVIAEVDQTCFCDANGCSIGTPAQNITLDGALSEDQQTFTGTLALPKGSGTTTTNYTIVLKRQ